MSRSNDPNIINSERFATRSTMYPNSGVQIIENRVIPDLYCGGRQARVDEKGDDYKSQGSSRLHCIPRMPSVWERIVLFFDRAGAG